MLWEPQLGGTFWLCGVTRTPRTVGWPECQWYALVWWTQLPKESALTCVHITFQTLSLYSCRWTLLYVFLRNYAASLYNNLVFWRLTFTAWSSNDFCAVRYACCNFSALLHLLAESHARWQHPTLDTDSTSYQPSDLKGNTNKLQDDNSRLKWNVFLTL